MRQAEGKRVIQNSNTSEIRFQGNTKRVRQK